MSGEKSNKRLEKLVKWGLGVVAVMALVNVIAAATPDFITVSNSVNGRELPIYCVDTEEKKVALSFDAAWGNEDTEIILEILKENDVKVTFL